MIEQLDLIPPDAGHDAGGGRQFALAPDVMGFAVFGGPKDCYRYRLERRIVGALNPRTMMFLWMNPSVASGLANDTTVAKGWRLALRWGFQRMLVANADAYRCTEQERLAEVDDPCGPENFQHIMEMAEESELVVVGYGTPKVRAVRSHGLVMARRLHAAGVPLTVLRLSKDGVPCHPLLLPESLVPVPWEPPA